MYIWIVQWVLYPCVPIYPYISIILQGLSEILYFLMDRILIKTKSRGYQGKNKLEKNRISTGEWMIEGGQLYVLYDRFVLKGVKHCIAKVYI